MNSNLQNNFPNVKSLIKTRKPEWWLSWPVIIVFFVVFWPIALFLIWKRTSVDKKTALNSGRVIGITGWFFLVFAALGLFVGVSEGFKSEDIKYIIFFILAGAGSIVLGQKIKSSAKKYRKYISIVINDGLLDIDNIAAAIPTSYENAKKDLQKMIDRGYFEGAYISESERQIVVPRKRQESLYNQSNDSEQEITMQVVTCKGCGAQNSIVSGTLGECEFCGSKIETK